MFAYFRDLLMKVVWRNPKLGLWLAEERLYYFFKGPKFARSVANDITLFRGRVSYVGINLLYVTFLVGLCSAETLLCYTLVSLVVTLIGDVLDGSVAREMGPTKSGGFLDLCSDGAGVLFPLIMVLHFLAWNPRCVIPTVGIIILGFLVLAHRGKNNGPTHRVAKISQFAAYMTVGVLFAGVLAQEDVLGAASLGVPHQMLVTAGMWMLWGTFTLKIWATLRYHFPSRQRKTPSL